MKGKKFSFAGMFVLVLVLVAATFAEKYAGTDFVVRHVYHSWWFVLLWGWVALWGCVAFWRRPFRWPSVMLHASFLLILLGALLTFLTARRGMVHLREGLSVTSFYEETAQGRVERRLPFTMRLDTFSVRYYPGSDMPSDYMTSFSIHNRKETVYGKVSMNRIFSYQGIRFYQSSYDTDGKGSYLSINEDLYGIPVTYAGYFLLFLSFLGVLLDPKGAFRRILRHPRLHRMAFLLLLSMGAVPLQAAPTLDKGLAEDFGALLVSYNGRVCPMQTLALDLVRKLHGSEHYQSYSAEQVLSGFLFYAEDWDQELIVRVKEAELRKALHCGKYVSVRQLVSNGNYLLQPYVEAYHKGIHSKCNKAALELDERLQLLAQLRQGSMVRMFPAALPDGKVLWYSPVDSLPEGIPQVQRLFAAESLAWLYVYGIRQGDQRVIQNVLDKLRGYQHRYGGESLPEPFRIRAEQAYNRLSLTGHLYKINLGIGLVLFLVLLCSLWRNRPLPYVRNSWWRGSIWVLQGSVFVALTLHLVLRFLACGRLPLGNGHETMLLLSWLVLLLGFLLFRFFPALVSFGFLLSGFFLLVSSLSQMDPAMTHLVPVLSSPLLGVHVSLIMSAYALLSFTALCALLGLMLQVFHRGSCCSLDGRQESLQLLSRLFLYPGVALLAAGIFVGAIWANVSWGRYWGWDPKEVWALINLLLYAVPLHGFRFFRSPVRYHLYLLFCFLTILMTYVGVNYFLGGMHSYA